MYSPSVCILVITRLWRIDSPAVESAANRDGHYISVITYQSSHISHYISVITYQSLHIGHYTVHWQSRCGIRCKPRRRAPTDRGHWCRPHTNQAYDTMSVVAADSSSEHISHYSISVITAYPSLQHISHYDTCPITAF